MKLHPHIVPALLVLALAACRPGAAEFTDTEAPKQLRLDEASARMTLHFAGGQLVSADAAKLRAMAASGRISGNDRVTVALGGPPGLAAARFDTITAELLHYGVIPERRQLGGLPANQGVMDTGRYLVTLPPCPNWSRTSPIDFTNAHGSNFGCANSVNLGMSVWSPADLAEGRPVGLADAVPAAAAVQRYQSDKVVLPSTTSVGPISGGSTGATGSGATGQGTAGSGP